MSVHTIQYLGHPEALAYLPFRSYALYKLYTFCSDTPISQTRAVGHFLMSCIGLCGGLHHLTVVAELLPSQLMFKCWTHTHKSHGLSPLLIESYNFFAWNDLYALCDIYSAMFLVSHVPGQESG
jgi:hypothetical protein